MEYSTTSATPRRRVMCSLHIISSGHHVLMSGCCSRGRFICHLSFVICHLSFVILSCHVMLQADYRVKASMLAHLLTLLRIPIPSDTAATTSTLTETVT